MRRPPVLFPLAGVFHLFWVVWTFYDDRMLPFPGVEWLQVLWLAGFAACWVAAGMYRRWGVWGYAALTAVDVCMNFAYMRHMVSPLFVCNIFPADVIFSLILMVYYKRISGKLP